MQPSGEKVCVCIEGASEGGRRVPGYLPRRSPRATKIRNRFEKNWSAFRTAVCRSEIEIGSFQIRATISIYMEGLRIIHRVCQTRLRMLSVQVICIFADKISRRVRETCAKPCRERARAVIAFGSLYYNNSLKGTAPCFDDETPTTRTDERPR